MVNDGQLEPDRLQPLSVRLAFRVDLHLIDQNLHQSAAFCLGHGGIELVKANQDLIDATHFEVATGDPRPFGNPAIETARTVL